MDQTLKIVWVQLTVGISTPGLDQCSWLYFCDECQKLHNIHFDDPKDDLDSELSTCPAEQDRLYDDMVSWGRENDWWDVTDEDAFNGVNQEEPVREIVQVDEPDWAKYCVQAQCE